MTGWQKIIIEAAIVTGLSGVIAVATNLLRNEPLPWVASEPYEIFVPCPEPLGVVEAIAPDAPGITDEKTVIIDARTADEFASWHLDRATNVTFDYLDPIPEEILKSVVKRTAASGARSVVVYGDGGDPDSGREMARELAGRGLKNVFFVTGGATALMSEREQGDHRK